MDTSKANATEKSKFRSTIVLEDVEVPENQVIEVEAEQELNWTESDEDLAT